MPIIKFEGVSKHFKTAGKTADLKAVDEVTLEINEGEIFSIIGHSGAGKSTLVRLINGLESVSSGSLQVLGHQLAADGVSAKEAELKSLRREVGMIFQQFNLFNAKTVYKNVEFPLKIAKWPKAERQARVAELLEFVGLSEKAKAHPSQLSGGQKQRVGIARALATDPKILLADEATSALDPETTLDVLRLLRKVNRELGITIVVITHTMSVVRLVSDRVAVMNSGKVVEVGAVAQIIEKPTHQVTKEFIHTFNILETGQLDD